MANSNSEQYYTVTGIVIYHYPILILNVNISSTVSKIFNYFDVASFSCYVQGRYLIKRRKQLPGKSEIN